VELLARQHIGGAPVMEGNRVVGVVTADDVLSFLASEPVVPRVREEEQEYEAEPEEEPAEEGVEAPAAFFADTWSDAGAEAVERFEALESPEWDLLGEHVVAEAMTRRLLRIGPDQEVSKAAKVMHDERVHRLLVMDGKDLFGIVTATDVMNAVAEGRLA
jgi:CBS domain-containing protein